MVLSVSYEAISGDLRFIMIIYDSFTCKQISPIILQVINNVQEKYFPSPTKYQICGLLLGTPHYPSLFYQNPGLENHKFMVFSCHGTQNC